MRSDSAWKIRARSQSVQFRRAEKIFQTRHGEVAALKDFSCDISHGNLAVILGPSGCGKSTAIRMIAGLEKPTSGSVWINGIPVEGPARECSMVFQAYTSFPWLSVIDNIAFGLRYSTNLNKKETRERAEHYASMVGLGDFLHASIGDLSGGMKQRVAIASALATEPEILLMDEPFGALDSQTRMVMQEHLVSIVEGTQMTVVFVTHDIEEALLLGDRIYICSTRPARILAEMEVPFSHPRGPKTRNERSFFDMKYQIFNILREEAYAQMLIKARAGRDRGHA